MTPIADIALSPGAVILSSNDILDFASQPICIVHPTHIVCKWVLYYTTHLDPPGHLNLDVI